MQLTLRSLTALVLTLILSSPGAPALGDEWAAGIPVGTPFPNIQATDHLGKTWNREKLLGENGLAFFFVRSTDW